MEDSGHVERKGRTYRITEKGSRNCEIVESSLPYTLRSRLEKRLSPMAEGMRRRAMIGAKHQEVLAGCQVCLTLSDEMGAIMELKMICGGEEHAEKIEANFRDKAEDYYNRIVNMLSE